MAVSLPTPDVTATDIKTGKWTEIWYRKIAEIALAISDTVTVTTGLVKFTSGTVTTSATLDIVLTDFTSYRGIVIQLSNFVPATDNDALWLRLSTDGGTNYDAGASDYIWVINSTADTGAATAAISAAGDRADSQIVLNVGIGNGGVAEGLDHEITIMGQSNGSKKPRVYHRGTGYDSGDLITYVSGAGRRAAAQDTNAIRIMFSSGNITTGKYAVYGLA